MCVSHDNRQKEKEQEILRLIGEADPYAGGEPYRDKLIPRRAAVMIPLLAGGDGYEVLYEVRAGTLELQPGDISFPGGHMEKGETSEEAVRREVAEELLLQEHQIEILRKLPLQGGPGGAIVTPFVGLVHDYKGTFDKQETERILRVPLDFFMQTQPAVYTARDEVKVSSDFPHEKVGDGKGYHFLETPHDFYFYEYEENVIWGFTARLTAVFVRMLKSDF